MNRNTVIGLLLIGAIFIGWSYWMTPSEDEIAEQQRKQDSLMMAQQKRIDSLAQIKAEQQLKEAGVETAQTEDRVADATPAKPADRQLRDQYGDFSQSAMLEDKFFIIENELFKIKISKKGGKVYSVELKEYVTYDSMPLVLFGSDTSRFGFAFFNGTRAIHTDDMYFQPHWTDSRFSGEDHIEVTGQDSVKFAMRLYVDGTDATYNKDKYVEYLYTVHGNKYDLDYTVNLANVQDVITTRLNMLDLEWLAHLRLQEKNVDRWNGPTIFYKFYEDDVDNLGQNDEADAESLKTRVKWISYKQHFFCSVLMAENHFENADVETFTVENPANPDYLKSMKSTIGIEYAGLPYQSIPMKFYFGPMKYNILKKYDLRLERQIPLGWGFFLLSWINIYVTIPVFNFLGSFGWNYGIVILVLTILLKIVLFPIAYKTYMSSAKMRVLRPEIEELNKKFPKKEEAMKKQQATMALYKKAGVNPLAGCIPMLLQMPILIALFRFFPSSIELRQESFLWAEDLSTYDSIWDFPGGFEIPFYGDHVSLFTLLMTASTIIYTRLNNQMMSSNQQMPGMKTMMYIMPLVFLGIFNNYSSGLSYYYFLANVITFAQMYLFRLAVDEDKLRRKIQERKKKPVKKSKFQKRLEEAAKKRGYQPPKR